MALACPNLPGGFLAWQRVLVHAGSGGLAMHAASCPIAAPMPCPPRVMCRELSEHETALVAAQVLRQAYSPRHRPSLSLSGPGHTQAPSTQV